MLFKKYGKQFLSKLRRKKIEKEGERSWSDERKDCKMGGWQFACGIRKCGWIDGVSEWRWWRDAFL